MTFRRRFPTFLRSLPGRVVVAVVAPLLVLGLAEFALRLADVGYPTSYFLPARIAGQARWIDNPDFARRFFPAGQLRQPPPTVVAPDKPPGTVRILVLGESAAMGDPQPAFGVSRYLEVLLRERYPSGRFEVVPVAMTAINSHALLAMAREARPLAADFWIVFAGNNEMLGPYGAGSALGRHAPPLPLVRVSLAVKSTRLGQVLERLGQRLHGDASGPTRWEGLRLFSEQYVPEGSAERARVYAAFEHNLRDLVRLGQRSGARVLLGSVPVNLRDCAPFGAATRPPEPEWDRLLEEGEARLNQGSADAALALFQQAERVHPDDAGLQFRLGQTELARSQPAAAWRRFARARDLDPVPLRADSRLNEITASIARETGAEWRDHLAALAASTADGIPGAEFFYEHVHLTPRGNEALARSFAESVAVHLPAEVTRGATTNWASAERCATRLALNPWNQRDALEMMVRRCSDPPFTRQLNHEVHLRWLNSEVARCRALETRQEAVAAQAAFTNAITGSPEDHHLRRSYAEFLDATGNLEGAIGEWRRLTELLPHHFRGWYQAGTDLVRANRPTEAVPFLERVIRLQPDWPEGYVALGQAFYQNHDPAGALARYDRALRLDPRLAPAHRHRADALASLGRRSEGLASLETAVKLNPGYIEARYLLGVEYAALERIADATVQFGEVTRLQPRNVRAHFNLGVALARQGRLPEAAAAFEATLRLDAAHAEAKRMLQKIRSLQEKREGVAPGIPK